MKYKIINATTLVDLMKKVNEELNDSWKLQGGVTVTYLGVTGAKACYQAMTAEDNHCSRCGTDIPMHDNYCRSCDDSASSSYGRRGY